MHKVSITLYITRLNLSLLSISMSLLTWHPYPPSFTNIGWWCSITGSEAKGSLCTVPVAF